MSEETAQEANLTGTVAQTGVIGTLLRYPDDPVVNLILTSTTVDDFTIAPCRAIRLAASKVDQDNFTVGALKMYLEQQGDLGTVVDHVGLAQVLADAPVPAAVPDLISALKSYRAGREIENIAQGMGRAIETSRGNTDSIISVVEQSIDDMNTALIGVGADQVSELGDAAFDLINKDHSGPSRFVSSGLPELDEYLGGGFGEGTLTTLAARPGFGKSALAIDIFRTATMDNIPCMFFSLEMGIEEVTARYVGPAAEIGHVALRKGRFTPEEGERLRELATDFKTKPAYIDTRDALSPRDLASTFARFNAEAKMVYGQPIRLVIVDYLQLLESGKEDRKSNRQEEVSSFTRALKRMSKREDLAVVALSQLRRGDSKRDVEHRPSVQDLRESGAIEQDSDIVLLLASAEESETGDARGEMDIIVGKNRNGPKGDIPVTFMAHYPTFVPRERSESFDSEDDSSSDIAEW